MLLMEKLWDVSCVYELPGVTGLCRPAVKEKEGGNYHATPADVS